MKNKKIISILLIIIFIVAFAKFTNVNAASINLSVPSSVTVGDTITATISGTAEQWNLSLSANGTTIASTNNLTNEGSEITISKTGTYSASSEGTVTFTLTGDYSYTSNNSVKNEEVNITKTVTIKAPASTGGDSSSSSGTSSGGGSSSSGGSTSSTTTTEPKFKDVSKTVYATGDINLRASWSTSSKATPIKKDTELRLTGTSTETVNGYVWYRVTYDGQIKYVAKNLVTETKPEEEKSNNVNLKKLEITGVDLEPKFSADVTEYTAKISNYTEKELNVTAEAEDEKTTVKIEGNKDIKIGENTITITTTAEDGTTKVYTIKITNEETDAFGLASLKIKDVELKNFKTDKYEYEISFSDLDKLEIEAIANQEGATIEVIGNEDLKEGENIITIVVTSKDGEDVATYQIKAKKLTTVGQNENRELNIVNIALSAIIALIVLITIIILIMKYVKNKDEVEKNDDEDFGHNDIFNKEDNIEDENPYSSLDKEAEDDGINYEKEYYEDTELDEEEIDDNKDENIDFKDIQDNEDSEIEEIEKIEETIENEPQRYNKYSVDDLFKTYQDDGDRPRRRGKGKHSK